jgi:hypothetical protein
MRSLLPSIAMNLTKTVPADGRVDVVRASAMEAEARRQMAFAHRRGASFRKDRPHRLPSVPSHARAVLMHANDGCVDHLHRNIMSLSECAHNLGPNASSSPVSETIVAGRVRAEVVRQVAPWRPRSQETQKMPLRTRGSFTRGTPRGLLGSIGLMAVHSLSVSS